MVAALYLIKRLADAKPPVPVRLFEGFVTFKTPSKGRCAAHLRDVADLDAIVRNPARPASSIVASDQLKADPTDSLRSAGHLCGFEFGIPAVLRVPPMTESNPPDPREPTLDLLGQQVRK
jgi:hypothetical protein